MAGADRLALSGHIVFDDLMALARFRQYPDDELTLAALLKSLFCGWDDEALYALAHGRERNLWAGPARPSAAKRATCWSRCWQQGGAPALRVLRPLPGDRRRRRPHHEGAAPCSGWAPRPRKPSTSSSPR